MSTLETLLALLVPATLETLLMVAVATLVSCVVGLAVGVIVVVTEPQGLLPSPLLHRALGVLVNIGRSIPFVILMVAIVPFTRLVVGTSIGTRAAIAPLVVAAIPYVARLVETSLRDVPAGIIEAVVTMGATPLQVIRHAYLREALPALIRGATLTAISLVSYSAMAGAVGGGGLGDLAVRYGYQRFRTDVMVATVVVLLVLVQGLQAAGERLARHVDHR
ncbi:methionine ABC transporter permease [Chondromyces crocatus]|uniref:Methionine ABC transporter permease n=1 Tax=Chondromyces crocatus TaxID=52 RepID=A0A0K1E9R0_CHOCO|nr:methionine ABC transporter permease [Chondromyces crocatus]AKT37600.1 methionine ABC transporter permease [Chondromyces crocatus]